MAEINITEKTAGRTAVRYTGIKPLSEKEKKELKERIVSAIGASLKR